jgi:hypothetical protein
MPTDWDAIDRAIKRAKNETDDALASRISSVTRLTDDEVKKLFPVPADAAKLAELMRIVTEGTTKTQKVNALVANIERLGGTVITLLNRFVT